uniref:Uncharacterized protein n=1 Tax=Cucumis melo TaxID=3656 RepID=A0A9I9EE97_CUCME
MQKINTNKSQTSVSRKTNLLEVLGGNTGKVERANSMNQKQENSSDEEVPNRWRSRCRHSKGQKKGERRREGEEMKAL